MIYIVVADDPDIPDQVFETKEQAQEYADGLCVPYYFVED